MPEIGALIACGTDGEKQLSTVFKGMRTMLYSLGALFITKEILRNIWKKCGCGAESKQLFLEKIFSKEENKTKFCVLIECSSDGEFDEKLKTLKPVWDARELAVSEKTTFHEWFITEKVDSFSPCFFIL